MQGRNGESSAVREKDHRVGGEDRKTHFQAFVDPIPHESLPMNSEMALEVNIHHFQLPAFNLSFLKHLSPLYVSGLGAEVPAFSGNFSQGLPSQCRQQRGQGSQLDTSPRTSESLRSLSRKSDMSAAMTANDVSSSSRMKGHSCDSCNPEFCFPSQHCRFPLHSCVPPKLSCNTLTQMPKSVETASSQESNCIQCLQSESFHILFRAA